MMYQKPVLTLMVSTVFSFIASHSLAQAPVVNRGAVPAEPEDNSPQLLIEVQTLREEVSSLRGIIEELEYKLGRLEKNQQENYDDLDGRVRDLYTGAVQSTQVPVAPSTNPSPNAPLDVQAESGAQSNQDEAGQATALYQEGFGALRRGETNEAISAFDSLVATYPNAREVPDALYWLGETYWLANQRENSRQAFVQLLDSSPNYRKAGDAMYRLGVIYDQLGDFDTAFDYMSQVLLSGSAQATAAQAWINENRPEEPDSASQQEKTAPASQTD